MADQLYQMTITASGTVRDADGNVLNQDVPIETTVVLTEAEVKAQLERLDPL